MNTKMSSLLQWLPRVLGLLFALFLGLFALDVFEIEASFWELLGGFLIHLMPTFLILAGVAIAWRWPLQGGILCLLLTFLLALRFGGLGNWLGVLPFFSPLTVVGALFILDGWLRRDGNMA